MAPSHNATKYRTPVGTFQVKYSPYGGKLGSTSVSLSVILAERKKVIIPRLTGKQLIEQWLRLYRDVVGKLEIRVHVAFTAHDLAVADALKEYVV